MQTATITFEGYFTDSWVDFSSDVLNNWRIQTGWNSIDPVKRVADVGTLTLELNNSTTNSAGLAGYYSPGHTNCRSGFTKRMPVRMKTVYSGTTTYYKFYIKSVRPSPGQYNSRRTMVIAEDKMADFARKNVGYIGVQTNTTSNALMDLIVGDMITAPDNTSFATGPEQMAAAFTDIMSEKMKLLALANKVMMSDWSRLFLAPDNTDGETMTTITRSYGDGASTVTIDDTMLDVVPEITLDNLVSRVRVTSYPYDVNAAKETIYTHPEEVYVGPGEIKSFTARFNDKDTGQRICAADVTDPLVAGTHFNASSSEGSGGNDANSFCSIDISASGEPVAADHAKVYVENTDLSKWLYLNYLILEGRPIRRRDTFEYEAEASDIATVGEERTIKIDMPYCTNTNLPIEIANKLIDDWGSENAVRSYEMEFNANSSTSLAGLAFNSPLGTKITIQETQSGLNHAALVLGKSLEHMGGNIINCRLSLDPAFGVTGAWHLGVTGKSELGHYTTLGL